MANLNYIRAINVALTEEMERDPDIFLAGEDVGEPGGSFTETRGIWQKYGFRRAKDTPISESAILGIALGAAMAGLRPVVEIMFNDFIGVCADQLFNQIAKARYMFGSKFKLPITIMANCGGGISAGPQHSQSWEAMCMHVPGLKVVMPATVYDAKGLLKAAIRDDDPVVYLHHKALYRLREEISDGDYTVSLGKAAVRKEGRDVTLLAVSAMVHTALKAAGRLEQEGIKAEVIDLRSIVPLDKQTVLDSVKKTGRAVIVHEAVKVAGIGAEVSAMIMEEAFDYLDAPIQRVAAPYVPVPFSPALEKAYLPDEEAVIQAVRKIA